MHKIAHTLAQKLKTKKVSDGYTMSFARYLCNEISAFDLLEPLTLFPTKFSLKNYKFLKFIP